MSNFSLRLVSLKKKPSAEPKYVNMSRKNILKQIKINVCNSMRIYANYANESRDLLNKYGFSRT